MNRLMNKGLLFLLISLVLPQIMASQSELTATENLDSTIVQVNEMLYKDSLRKETYALAKEALNIAYLQKSPSKKAEVHGLLSAWHDFYKLEESANDSVIYHETKALKLYQALGKEEKVATSNRYLAIAYMNIAQFKNAEIHLLESLAYYEKTKDQKGLGKTFGSLCGLYNSMEEYHKSIEYGIKSNHILESIANYTGICINNVQLVRSFLSEEQYKEALIFANQGLEIMEDKGLMENYGLLARLIDVRGTVYEKIGNYSAAEKDYREAWKIMEDWVGEERANSWRESIGNLLVLQGGYEEALPHLLAGVADFKGTNSIWKPFEKLKNCYENLGDYENAYLYSERVKAMRDSMYNDKIATLETEGLLKYETGKKEEALRVKDVQLLQQKRIQWLGFGVLSLLGLFLFGLLYNYRKNQRFSKQLQLLNTNLNHRNEEKEVLLKEIHHRVKNNLQVISSLLNFQSRSVQDQNAKSAILDSQSRVRSMSLIHQKLYRGTNLAAVEMKSYLEVLAESLIDAYADEEIIDVKLNMKNLELDVDYAIPIGLIVNELVTNSLKYAFPRGNQGAVEIELYQQNEELILAVSDDGIGEADSKAKNGNSGFGSELVEMLTQQLKGRLTKFTDDGFQTRLRFPYAKAA